MMLFFNQIRIKVTEQPCCASSCILEDAILKRPSGMGPRPRVKPIAGTKFLLFQRPTRITYGVWAAPWCYEDPHWPSILFQKMHCYKGLAAWALELMSWLLQGNIISSTVSETSNARDAPQCTIQPSMAAIKRCMTRYALPLPSPNPLKMYGFARNKLNHCNVFFTWTNILML